MVSFITPTLRSIETATADHLVLFCFEEKRPFRGITSLVDWRLGGHLSRLVIEDFFTGKKGSSLLVIIDRRMPQRFLTVCGLGPRSIMNEQLFKEALYLAWKTHHGLKAEQMAISLPGRVENVCDSKTAVGWLIDVCEEISENPNGLLLIEDYDAKKEATPTIERWRLRKMIPGFGSF